MAVVGSGANGSKKHPAEALPPTGSCGKKYKAADHVPTNASSEIYASIFTSSRKGPPMKETYTCRSTSARGMNLT